MFDRILISETTKEERAEIMKEMLAMATVGCPKPTQEQIDFYNQYVDGKKEILELYNETCAEYGIKGTLNKYLGEKA